jgi:FtsH-binding integral membrane protein
MSRQFKTTTYGTDTKSRSIDEGLRSYFLKVYQYMALGLALTGMVALFVSTNTALMQTIFMSPLRWVVMLAPIGMVLFLSYRIQEMSTKAAQISFWTYAALMGVSLSFIFVVYTGESITKTFFITASMFGGMSLYGYTTKRDLTGMGSFLMMGLIGLIIASVVNLFLASSALSFITSIVGVLIFTGLTAYDTQQLKGYYYAFNRSDFAERSAIMGALSLYLDFINIFMSLLRLMGDRR